MPWQICPDERYVSLYDRIDQGMGCFYFVSNQQLSELKDKGYYSNSLIYHEPYRSWMIRFISEYGSYLSNEVSWCQEYYRNALANKDFHLDDDTYEDPSNWKSFNDFFSRKLKDPSKRPIDPRSDVVVSTADSIPQGIWQIDEDNRVIDNGEEVAIKTGTLKDVASLLKGSKYAECFAGGKMSHAFLDINDYHRYHFPLSGMIKEAYVIRADATPSGLIIYDEEKQRYFEPTVGEYGWQSLETRGVVIMETDNGGYVAIVPVGICTVSSVNFEENVKPGNRVEKGDPLGYFLFGGSEIVMLFGKDLDFEFTAEKGKHLQMGQEYGRIKD